MYICQKCFAVISLSCWTCADCGFSPEERCSSLYTYKTFIESCFLDGAFFDEKAFGKLVQVEEKSFWFIARNQLIINLLNTYCADFNSFLELGCGTGYVLKNIMEHFKGPTYSAVEIYKEAIPFIFERVGREVNVYQLDARYMVFKDEFDVIGSFDVLEHIEEDVRVIEQIHLSLKPGGIAILAVPQHLFLWSQADEDACHKRRYKRGELEYKLKMCGFSIVYSTSYLMTLVPFMLLSRLMKNNPNTEHNPVKIINTSFKALLALERLLIKLKLNLPFGGSRFVIARKHEL